MLNSGGPLRSRQAHHGGVAELADVERDAVKRSPLDSEIVAHIDAERVAIDDFPELLDVLLERLSVTLLSLDAVTLEHIAEQQV